MILIIGAGPIGIEMAVELSRCKVPFRIVDAGSTASTIEWYAPGTEIFSSPERIAIAGIPFEPLTRKAFREDYLLYLRNVVRQFKLPIEHYRRVVGIENKSNYHRLRKFCSRQKTDLFDQLGVTLVNAQPVVDQSTMETNVPNVFVIGTAAAGTELGGVTTFIENTHIHVKRVLHALNLIEHVHAAPDRPIDEREI